MTPTRKDVEPTTSATGELRRLLDKRGVKWNATDTYRLLVTSWKDDSGHNWAFMEHRDGNFSKLTAYHLTPAQAITATLGAGTCVPILNSERDCRPYLSLWFVCSECGCRLTENRLGKVWQKFCPNCGAKVVGE